MEPVARGGGRPWYRTYRTALVLLALAIVGFAVSYAVFPRAPSVAVHGGVEGIAVLATFAPTNIDIAERPAGHGTVELQIGLRAATRTVAHPGEITLVVPAETWGSAKACPGATFGCTIDPAGLKDVHYDLSSPSWVAVAGSDPQFRYELPLTIDIPDAGLNYARNAEYIATLLPPVRFQLAPQGTYSSAHDAVVPVKFAEEVRHQGYTWSTGTIPVYLAGSYLWTYSSASDVQSAVSPTLDSGTDLNVQTYVTNMTFVAGALIGIAGGALIGAAQVALDAQAESRDSATKPAGAATTP